MFKLLAKARYVNNSSYSFIYMFNINTYLDKNVVFWLLSTKFDIVTGTRTNLTGYIFSMDVSRINKDLLLSDTVSPKESKIQIQCRSLFVYILV